MSLVPKRSAPPSPEQALAGATQRVPCEQKLIRARVLTGYGDLVVALGGEPAAILQSAAFDPVILEQPETEISFRDCAALLETTAARLECPDFGMRLAETQSGIMLMGPLEPLLKNVPTLADSLIYSARHMHIYSSAFETDLERGYDRDHALLRFEVTASDVPYRRQITEQCLLLTYSGTVLRTGGKAYPREIWFSHQKIARADAYNKRFRAKVLFSQPVDGILYTDEDLDALILDSNPEELKRQVAETLSRFPPVSSISREVRTLISRTIFEPDCTRQAVAAALGIHPRSLHRYLLKEGVTFEGLKDEIRRELAAHYLAQSDVTLVDVAGRLGYSELSIFSRACRRWFGNSPRRVRQLFMVRDPSFLQPRL